jgi:Cu+-exporting ATPase
MSPEFPGLIHIHVHYWESSSVLILIVLVGKFIESFSKTKTIGQLSRLASLKVTKASMVLDNSNATLTSKVQEVPVEVLGIDDHVIVVPGGALPIDGVVV